MRQAEKKNGMYEILEGFHFMANVDGVTGNIATGLYADNYKLETMKKVADIKNATNVTTIVYDYNDGKSAYVSYDANCGYYSIHCDGELVFGYGE